MKNTTQSNPKNNSQNSSLRALGWSILLFPICLVLFEFTVYIGNDMTQPAMPKHILPFFNAGEEWNTKSMSYYIIGGMILQWIIGPLADRKGRRLVMLSGVLFFMIMCLVILLANSIEQFMAIRLLQGIGLCFIGAVGYAAIQDSFSETIAIKLTAIMANVSLIAPMLGPLMGSEMIKYVPWQMIFVLFAGLSLIAFAGLFKSMPESAPLKDNPLVVKEIYRDYVQVLTNPQFLRGALAIGFAVIPLLTWIAQTPMIFMEHRNFSNEAYSLLQIPVFVSLLCGNFTLTKLTGKVAVTRPIFLGAFPMLLGVLIAVLGLLFIPDAFEFMVIGVSIYAYGLGVANAGLYRLTLFSSHVSKGTVSAGLGMINAIMFAIGIEIANVVYLKMDLFGFNLISFICIFAWCYFAYRFILIHKKSKGL
ncbi:MFS transporter [Thorsellia kenyensis]|uniref:Multidrug transporter MdfA n=1 Tax=Thorsellia kenyensis TaxID=1549888 RepID=A0ABV6CCY3_9GAMM